MKNQCLRSTRVVYWLMWKLWKKVKMH